MKTFIKNQNRWEIEKDQRKILDAPEGFYVFAESTQDAAHIINTNFNDLYPDFLIVRSQKSWDRQNYIEVFSEPVFNIAAGSKRALELIKENGYLKIRNSYDTRRKLEKDFGKRLLELGIVYDYDRLKLDPKEAKKKLAYEKRLAKGTTGRPNYIQMYDIERAQFGLRHEVVKAVRKINPNIEFKLTISSWNRKYNKEMRKFAACKKVLTLVSLMEDMFGSFSYRQVKKFQAFKKMWKKTKPKSAKQTYLPEDFFDFMQIEVTRRTPKPRELKLRWKTSKGGSRDGGE